MTLAFQLQRAYYAAVLLLIAVRAFQNSLNLARNGINRISIAVNTRTGNRGEADCRLRQQLSLKASEDDFNESISRGFLPSGPEDLPGDLAPIGNSNNENLRSTSIRSQLLTYRLFL